MNFEDWEEIAEYCMNKPCVYESRPFGEYPICYRIAGKIFCQLSVKENWYKATLKTNPDAADFYRSVYPGTVVRGYHCPPVQQPYWNTVELFDVPFSLVQQMIDEAYQEVLLHLPKRIQKRLENLEDFEYLKTDGTNGDFDQLCKELDENLEEMVAGKFERSKYAKYNTLDSIHDVIIIYKNGEAAGAGSYKFYDEETVEFKRIFIRKEYRGCGLGRELLYRLEADARIKGFRYAILETGELLVGATAMYQKDGFKVIPNYGQYIDMPESLCMKKKL